MKRAKRPTEPMHLVPCPGEAHSNAFIDNCMLCAPSWGAIEIPARFATYEEYANYPLPTVMGKPVRR